MGFLGDLLLGTIGMIVFALIYGFIQNGKRSTAANIVFDTKKNELTLKKQDPSSRKVLKVEEMWNHSINYEPERYVYTGATVGGVHTGGVHKEGGYNYLTGTSTGKYQIWYDNSMPYEYQNTSYRPSGGVESIKLADPKLVEKAKNSQYVSRYLHGDTLVLGYKTLSKQECKNIISWLCGEV